MRSVRPPRPLGPAALLLGLSVSCASIDPAAWSGTLVANVDNDSIDKSGDDHYSSGLAAAYHSDLAPSFAGTPLAGPVARWLDRRWPLEGEPRRFVIYSLSHRIFHPSDLKATEIVADDIPYSALLYGQVTAGSQGVDRLSALSLVLGLVGPGALGEELQSGAHAIWGSRDPEGWDNQLENEPLLNVAAEHRRRLWRGGDPDGLGSDLLVGLSGAAGNLHTQATLAATFRTGYRLPANFQGQGRFLGEEALGLRPSQPLVGERSVHVFAGIAGAALANAIYLDGNTFEDSHSVDHDPLALRGSIGIVARLGRLRAMLAYERTSLRWDPPDGQDADYYMRLGLSWDL